jgi:hypothetical protein
MQKPLLFGLLLFGVSLAGCTQPANIETPQPDCNTFGLQECPDSCVVCPPCEACSSIHCETKEFCQKIGFDENWWGTVRPR